MIDPTRNAGAFAATPTTPGNIPARTLMRFIDHSDGRREGTIREAIRAVEDHPELDARPLAEQVTLEALERYWATKKQRRAALARRDEADALVGTVIPREGADASHLNYVVSMTWERWAALAGMAHIQATDGLIGAILLWGGIDAASRTGDRPRLRQIAVRLDGTIYAVVHDQDDVDDQDDPRAPAAEPNYALVVINPQDFIDVDPGEPDDD